MKKYLLEIYLSVLRLDFLGIEPGSLAEAKMWKLRAVFSVGDSVVDFLRKPLFPTKNDITDPYRRPSMLSPHLGYVTRELLGAIYSDTVESVAAWLDGKPIRIANREALQQVPPAEWASFSMKETTMVTIIGAGMAGLTLARVLYKNGLSPVVYDADLSATSRHQGGMLDIHRDTGQAALRAAGLLDAFSELILENGDAIRILDKTGAVRMSEDGNGLRPEIERGALRDLLLSSLPAEMVHWDAKVIGIEQVGGNHELTFADGNVVTTAVLIGADGAWSKVRPLVSERQPGLHGLVIHCTL
jgi:hypothetical protein